MTDIDTDHGRKNILSKFIQIENLRLNYLWRFHRNRVKIKHNFKYVIFILGFNIFLYFNYG